MIHSSSHHSVHNYNILKREITRVNDDGNSSAVCRSKGDSKAFRRRGRRMCAKQLALISEIAKQKKRKYQRYSVAKIAARSASSNARTG